MRLVDAVVDDPDLDPGSVGLERRSGEVAGVDGRAVGAGGRAVGGPGHDASYTRQRPQPGEGGTRGDHREAVRDDPVAPAHDGAGERRVERHDEAVLLPVEPGTSPRPGVVGERPPRELDDDLDVACPSGVRAR